MDEKIKFIAMVNSGNYTFASVCAACGISRQAGYDLVARYEAEGERALVPRSRARHTQAHAMSSAMAKTLLDVKAKHARFGPRKVRDYLVMTGYREPLPAVSTIGELFKRQGLVRERGKPRARSTPHGEPLRHATAPNIVWSIDFKGQFKMGNGQYCYPLTLSDNASRYLFLCQALPHPTEAGVWPHLRRAFEEHGLPSALRSDNGAPFASTALGGLTRLAVWLLKLGITPERITPGRPDQNGRHERMHRTLKDYLEPIRASLSAQQRALEEFRRHYNHERPHESLGGISPAMSHTRSRRRYPTRLPTPEYAGDVEVRRVRSNGQIKWRGQLIFVSEALIGEPVGLQQIDDARWQLLFCSMRLGVLDEHLGTIERLV